jgi:hypothetical protein
MRSVVGAAIVLAAAVGTADARPHTEVVWRDVPHDNPAAVSSNVIFMNRCAGGCVVHQAGSDNSTTDASTIGGGSLTAFAYGDAVWGQVMACLRDTFEDFNVVITDVDPGTQGHLEIMIAGSPTQIGLGTGVGGIAPFTCQNYAANTLVFDFANVWGSGSTCTGSCVEDICSTAAQEIAHTWSLDHVTVAADPMTYYNFNGRRYYQNVAAQCGSDCLYTCGANKCDSFGHVCSGPNNQNKACTCSGSQTQNSWQTIRTLFGAGTPTPPVVMITNPAFGAEVQPGFNVTATATDDSSIAKVELRVDNVLVMPTITKPPYAFNAPATLMPGSHHVEVTAYDAHGTPGKGAIDVMIGPPCEKPADCAVATDTCVGGRCVPGPGVPGGLGTTCTDNSQCAEGQCASDGTNMYCVSMCMKGQCPDGFGCLSTGADPNVGACWPGYDDGSGGCSVAGGGPLSFGAIFVAFVLSRRRR